MNKILAALLFVFSTVAGAAAPNIIMKSWDWNKNFPVIQTIDEGGFPDGSVVIIPFTASFAGKGHLAISEWPATATNGANGVGCQRVTSVSTKPNDFDPNSAVMVRTGYNQGIDYQAGGTVPSRVDRRTGKVTYLAAPLEVGKKYYLNTKSVSPGCGNVRVQPSIFRN